MEEEIKETNEGSEKEEANTFSDFYKKIVETKTAEIVSSYDNSIKVKYN